MPEILVVFHSMSGNTAKAAEAVVEGINDVDDVDVVMKKAFNADTEDLLNCDGIAIGSPDYFSYMAGTVKDFFDRTYYPTKGEVSELPCFLFITHGGGGDAIDSLESMASTFEFEQIPDSILVHGEPDSVEAEKLAVAGRKLAEYCKERKNI